MADRIPLEKTNYPGVYKRPGKRGDTFVVIFRHNGQPKWESFSSLATARKAQAARKTDISRGEFQEQSNITFHEYAMAWIDRYQGRGRRGFRSATREDYRRQLKTYALRYFDSRLKVTAMAPSHVAAFVGWLASEEHQGRVLADATIRNICAPIKACLGTAVREGVIRSNPARDIDMPVRHRILEEEDEPVRVLTADQVSVFLAVAHPRYRLFFRVIAATGVRVSEAIALQWQDLEIDSEPFAVKVRRRIVKGNVDAPKSKYGRRSIPITFELVRALREHRAHSEWCEDSDYVFASRNGTALVPGNVYYRHLKPAMQEAGCGWAGYHSLRHTYCSLQIANGANIVQVSRALGHASAAFTLSRYSHVIPGGQIAPLDLDALSANGANECSTDDSEYYRIPNGLDDNQRHGAD